MKLFFVLDEGIYHPPFLLEFLRKTKDEVVGAAIVTKAPEKNDVEFYLMKSWRFLKLGEILKMAWVKFWAKIGNASVASVLKRAGIDFFAVEYDINKKQCLEKIREKKPDIIISSNPLLFGEELLKIPKRCCLNRHSALLPSYGGVLPVFQAYRNAEKYVGASIHTMEKRLDKGIVLSQRKVKVESSDTLHTLYKKCFTASVGALLDALDKVRKQDFSVVGQGNKPGYYSWPTTKQWKEFRRRGGRVI